MVGGGSAVLLLLTLPLAAAAAATRLLTAMGVVHSKWMSMSERVAGRVVGAEARMTLAREAHTRAG